MAVTGLLLLGLQSARAQSDDETIAWNAISGSQAAFLFEDFARDFPKGTFIDDARQRYVELTQGMERARNVHIEVNYPRDAAALPFSVGSRVVVLDVVVNPDGTAGAIKVTKRSGFDPIDRAAVGAAKRAVYLPAVENGVAVSSHLPFRIDFKLLCPGEFSLVSCKDGEFR